MANAKSLNTPPYLSPRMATREVALFLLTAFNALSDQWTAFSAGLNKVATGFWHYFTGTTNRWYFLPNAAVPIPASYYRNRNYNLENQDTIRLEYDTALGVLTYRPLRIAQPRSIQQMPWLSASLSVNGRIFNIDTWARTFRFDMITEAGGWFTPRTFVSCWSIETKIWPTPTDNAFLNVIDTEGNPYQFSVFGEYDENAWLRCLGDTDSETETETEEADTEEVEEESNADTDTDTEVPSAASVIPATEAPANSLSVSPISAEAPVAEAPVAEAVAEATVEATVEAVAEAVAEADAEAVAEAPVAEAAVAEDASHIIDGVSAFQRSLGAEAPAPAPADTATVATVMESVITEID